MKNDLENTWLKSKGYLHVRPQLNTSKEYNKYLHIVQNKKFVAKYSFFPLIHSFIKDRRYRFDELKGCRSHTKIDKKGVNQKNIKLRPLHYACNFDALIYGYYAKLLSDKYEAALNKIPAVSNSILAYRKFFIDGLDGPKKNSLHFAEELFDLIGKRAIESATVVLKFDIEKYFSNIDHGMLKKAWLNFYNDEGRLPDDHFNVFKAATNFSYILKDDFRVARTKKNEKSKKRMGFDERALMGIQKEFGAKSFFSNASDFRRAVRSREIRVYTNPFRNKLTREVVGIPQGLPISAVLSNIFLLDFDISIVNFLKALDDANVYRTYSDDIVVVCRPIDLEVVSNFVFENLAKLQLSISKEKTEKYYFNRFINEDGSVSIKSVCIGKVNRLGYPFMYLGFEYYGDRVLIKSANLAKFYRRMLRTVKRKCRYAAIQASRNAMSSPIVFRNQLFRLYSARNLNKLSLRRKKGVLVKDVRGGYRYVKRNRAKYEKVGNYLEYVKRVSDVFQDARILRQVRNHRRILRSAILKRIEIEKKRVGFT